MKREEDREEGVGRREEIRGGVRDNRLRRIRMEKEEKEDEEMRDEKGEKRGGKK